MGDLGPGDTDQQFSKNHGKHSKVVKFSSEFMCYTVGIHCLGPQIVAFQEHDWLKRIVGDREALKNIRIKEAID